MTRVNNQRGVSLIEALISVGLLAGLSSLLAPSIYGVTRTTAAITAESGKAESFRTVDKALSQIINNHITLANSESKLTLHGDDQTLSLVSLAGNQSKARLFSLKIRGMRLTGEISPLTGSATAGQFFELLDSGAVAFSYFGRPTENAPLQWYDSWSYNAPPQLIRFQYQNMDSGTHNETSDYALRTKAPLHCQFDPVSRRCRA